MSDDIAFRFLTWSALCPSCPPSCVGYHVQHATGISIQQRRATSSALCMPVLRRMPCVVFRIHSCTGHAYVRLVDRPVGTKGYGSQAAPQPTLLRH